MQTFLPYPSFERSATVLDDKRLGKQRVECLQILKALNDPTYGWQNHPAVKMWRGSTFYLADYAWAVCEEWTKRGYSDTCLDKICALESVETATMGNCLVPKWLGNEAFHASHRSNLLRKNPDHYRKFWPDEPDNLPYVWPV